jgi:hypothetical protein
MDLRALPPNLLHPQGQGAHRQIYSGGKRDREGGTLGNGSSIGPSNTRHFFLQTEKRIGVLKQDTKNFPFPLSEY